MAKPNMEVLNALIEENQHNAPVWKCVENLAQKEQRKLQKESEPSNG